MGETSIAGIQAGSYMFPLCGGYTLSNVHEFVIRLPQGYDTSIGNRGTLPSGRQKQRLAIARAIVKDPPILIIDEARSASDVTSEPIVQRPLDNVRHNGTTISIAHRLTTIQSADKIIAMRKGSVVETGTHNQLTAIENGVYRRLWDAQTLISTENPVSENDKEAHETLVSRHSTTIGNIEKDMPERVEEVSESQYAAFRARMKIFKSQKKFWVAFLILVISASIGGALFPMQTYLYAKVVTTFQLTNPALLSRGNFWALMWFVLAIVVAIAWFGVSGLGVGLGEELSQSYRFAYFRSIVAQPMAFFDSLVNSSSNILARLSTDPDAINSLAGSNLAVIVTVGVSLVSTIAFTPAIGWKLGLVIFGGLTLIFAAGVIHEENGEFIRRSRRKIVH